MEIDFRSVERAVALVHQVIGAHFFQRFFQSVRGGFPVLVAAHAVFGTGGKFHVILEPEQRVHLVDQPHNAFDFACNL